MKALLPLLTIACLVQVPPAPGRQRQANQPFVILDNGDRSIEGCGSVTAELQDYGIDVDTAPDSSRALMLAENVEEKRVYVYLFRTNTSLNYGKIDISTSTALDSNNETLEDWRTYSLTMVSISADLARCKYLIEDLHPDLTASGRRYAVREIYNDEHSGDITAVIPVAAEYLVGIDTNGDRYSQVNSIESVTISDKKLFFALIKPIYADTAIQDYYLAFNFASLSPDTLEQVDIRYKAYTYTCTTVIGVDMTDLNHDRFFHGFQGVKSCESEPKIITPEQQADISVTPASRSVTTGGPMWIFYQHSKTWNKIERVSDLEHPAAELKNYTWIVHFAEASLAYYSNGVPFRLRYEVKPSNMQGDYKSPLEVSDATVLRLTYKKEGQIKDALVVDTYSASSGNQSTERPLTYWEKVFRAWSRFFQGKLHIEDISYMITSSLIAVAGGFILYFVFKVFIALKNIIINDHRKRQKQKQKQKAKRRGRK